MQCERKVSISEAAQSVVVRASLASWARPTPPSFGGPSSQTTAVEGLKMVVLSSVILTHTSFCQTNKLECKNVTLLLLCLNKRK